MTVSFEKLVDAASEIAVAKDNVAEASGTLSMCAMSGGDKTKTNATCGFCNSNSHNANGFTEEVRQKFWKAFGKTCDKCQKINHISAACKSDQIRKRRDDKAKKATVNEVSAVVETPEAAAAPAAAAPAAVLNSVQAVAQIQQSAGYVFNPERFTEITGKFGKCRLWRTRRVCRAGVRIQRQLDILCSMRCRLSGREEAPHLILLPK